jgi:hypothetical protein
MKKIEKIQNTIDTVATTVEALPIVQKEKVKFSWIDRFIRWANRGFLAWWIYKRKGL